MKKKRACVAWTKGHNIFEESGVLDTVNLFVTRILVHLLNRCQVERSPVRSCVQSSIKLYMCAENKEIEEGRGRRQEKSQEHKGNDYILNVQCEASASMSTAGERGRERETFRMYYKLSS